MSLQIIIGIILGLAFAGGFYWLWKLLRLKNLKHSLGRELLLVKIPKDIPKSDAPPRDLKTEIGKFEQFLGNLASLKEPVSFEVAVPHVGEEIFFYLAVPKKYVEIASKQIQGVWNGASVERFADDYNIFNNQGASVAAYLKQKDNFAVPIRTYAETEMDAAGAILGGFAKVSEIGEGAALQVVLRPAPKSAGKAIRHSLDFLKQGYPLSKVAGNSMWEDLKEALKPQQKKKDDETKIVDEEAVKAVTAKLSKPLFQVNVRIVASAPSPFQANDILEGIAGGFEQLVSPTRNDLNIVKARNPQKLIYKFIFREFDAREAMVMSSEEIASLYHFPTSFTETPKVKWLKSREAPSPANMPTSGTLMGESIFRGDRKNVYMSDEDRRRHSYIIGQTGTGKSYFMCGMMIEDIKKGRGAALIDPHGELVELVLSQIPKERAEDVIVFDPGDLSRPLGINMLEYDFNRPEQKTFIVNEMLNIFDKLYDLKSTGGPMFEQYMRNALLLLMEDAPNEPATLVEVSRIFTDAEYRNRKLARITNTVVLDFWQKEATKTGGEASLANMTPYITSKFGQFVTNDYVRPIIGQVKSAFDLRDVMDSKKILLVNLSKGKIGDLNASLLGMVITGKILMAALSRVDTTDKSKLPDFSLYVDEFQNFATDSIATILSEARKYGLCLTMAHQFIAQLTDNIRDAVFGNVGTQVVFRVGATDAEFLVKQFEPVFNESDLMSIDNYNAHVKLLISGQTTKPFNMHAFPLPAGNYELGEHLKEYSRLKYGMERMRIEEEVHRRLRD